MASFVFPKVEPADIQRSRRDLSLYKVFTAGTGTLIPALCVDMIPDDWMRINTIATVQSLPMVAPVKGRWKVSFDYYYNPWSNIYGYMDNNAKMSTEQIVNQYRYVFRLGSDVPNLNSQSLRDAIKNAPKVSRGGLLDFIGCPVGYFGSVVKILDTGREIQSTLHPAEGIISYIDIVRNYYVNNQEQVAKIITGDANTYVTNVDTYSNVPLTSMDIFFINLRWASQKGLAENVLITDGMPADFGMPFSKMFSQKNIPSQIGLFLRTYRMDLLRGIMNTSVGEFKASVTVNDGSFNMDQVYFANKLQTLINRIDITGGRFSDWIRTRWNINPGIEVDRPIYLGSHSLWLNTIDVIATASGATDVGSRNDNSVLGQQVGYQVGKLSVGDGKKRQKPITIKSKQYGTLMCIFSIVPDVVYSQGFELNMLKTKFMDIYDPAFKQLGYQDVLRGEVYAFPSIDDQTSLNTLGGGNIREVIGKRVAWSEYMASLNRAHGDFAYGQSLDYWVNNRVYSKGNYVYNDESKQVIGVVYDCLHDFDASTYIYPNMWNNAFADTSASAMNYIVDVYFQIDANRSLGKRLMPHL